MQKKYFTNSSAQTKRLGTALARTLSGGRSSKRAVVIGLRGDLGGGKTTFLQGFAKGLGKKGRVLSPTFIIMRRMGNFYHIDCYRLRRPRELLELGFGEIITDPKNIVAVEWADMVKGVMPRYTVWVDFKFIDKERREIVVRSTNGNKK